MWCASVGEYYISKLPRHTSIDVSSGSFALLCMIKAVATELESVKLRVVEVTVHACVRACVLAKKIVIKTTSY